VRKSDSPDFFDLKLAGLEWLKERTIVTSEETPRPKGGFVMIQIAEIEKACDLFDARELKPEDGMVFLALLANTNRLNGHIRATADEIGKTVGRSGAHVSKSLSRLSKAHLLRRIKDEKGDGTFYALNPWMVECGENRFRGYLKKRFMEA
jgi:DNA-binding transcriptional ArsR family regulator